MTVEARSADKSVLWLDTSEGIIGLEMSLVSSTGAMRGAPVRAGISREGDGCTKALEDTAMAFPAIGHAPSARRSRWLQPIIDFRGLRYEK
jgi:hypothetical protein